MKLYTISVGKKVVDWAGTQADAKAAKRAREDDAGGSAAWEECEVPTDKPGLIAFLKKHAVATPTAPTGE